MRNAFLPFVFIACVSNWAFAQSVKSTPTPAPSIDEKNKIVDPVFSQEQLNQLPTKTAGRAARGNKPWVLLPETEADHAKQPCSRPGPPKFNGTWKPTQKDIQTIESRLQRIARLRTRSGIIGLQIKHPARYYRQYLGIIINNRKFIFVNAFCDDTAPEFWREVLIDACDGGCSWGVVYNVATGRFSHLEMNGVA